MRHLKGIVQYKGTNYHGWQVQPNGVTIQGALEQTISAITNEQTKVLAAGRTDAGVHALGQVIAFKTSSSLNLYRLKRAINALLPEDIRVIELTEADMTFHPRFDAKMKSYLYLINLGSFASPFIADFIWPVPYRLEVYKMIKESKSLLGRQDFSAFMGSRTDIQNPIRYVYAIDIYQSEELPFLNSSLKGDFIMFEIISDGFLRHMVRNIVGTLIDIGRGRLSEGSLKRILLSKDRKEAGITAPAKGLFLNKVYY